MNSTDRNLQTRDARNHSRFDVLNEFEISSTFITTGYAWQIETNW